VITFIIGRVIGLALGVVLTVAFAALEMAGRRDDT
jgi:hypothetical protein